MLKEKKKIPNIHGKMKSNESLKSESNLPTFIQVKFGGCLQISGHKFKCLQNPMSDAVD